MYNRAAHIADGPAEYEILVAAPKCENDRPEHFSSPGSNDATFHSSAFTPPDGFASNINEDHDTWISQTPSDAMIPPEYGESVPSERNILADISPSNKSTAVPIHLTPPPVISDSSNSLFPGPTSNTRRHQTSYSHMASQASMQRSKNCTLTSSPPLQEEDTFFTGDMFTRAKLCQPVKATHKAINCVSCPTYNNQQTDTNCSRFSMFQQTPESSPCVDASFTQSKASRANTRASIQSSYSYPECIIDDCTLPSNEQVVEQQLQFDRNLNVVTQPTKLSSASVAPYEFSPDATAISRSNTEGDMDTNYGKQCMEESGGTATPITYAAERVIGCGSFGVVYKAQEVTSGDIVAIKKVLQDKRYKNRELYLMKDLDCPCVVKLKHAFFTPGDDNNKELYLNLVMEYVGDTVYQQMKNHGEIGLPIPIDKIKIYAYQLCRALGYIHSIGICHRDIKPQNLLIDPETHALKICDFGSAKRLVPGYPNVAYICSRYCRAPELIFGATDYTVAIDIWSMGCVLAEMILGHPVFKGDTGVDQLVDIIRVLGTPTTSQLMAMNQSYGDFKFPLVEPVAWTKVFRNRSSQSTVDFISKLLRYSPAERLRPMEALAHEFFDDLRLPPEEQYGGILPCPNMFNFTTEELRSCSYTIREKLVPKWVRYSTVQSLNISEAEQYMSWFSPPKVAVNKILPPDTTETLISNCNGISDCVSIGQNVNRLVDNDYQHTACKDRRINRASAAPHTPTSPEYCARFTTEDAHHT